MTDARSKAPAGITWWIIFCAFCNCAGWVLSACHQLNLRGYAMAFFLGVAAVAPLRRRIFPANLWNWRKQRRRFSRLYPLGFLTLALLAALGGALHPPSNYDALAYRTPRVLHWLAAGHWHWISTDFNRLNTRGCGIEWVSAPLFVFARSDRWEFVFNVICFLLLPGRVFGLLSRLGVRPRVAWRCTWLLPSGYCYLLQAGSIGNDLFGALFAMAAVELALRAWQSEGPDQIWLSILAAGLMTAGKAFNLLLLLPWLFAAIPALRWLRLRPLATAMVLVVALGSSLLPTALLNHYYCGDWKGLAAEMPGGGNLVGGSRLIHFAGNTVLIPFDNFEPPIFPFANAWNKMMDKVIPRSVEARLMRNFEAGGAKLMLGEMESEESAGLGLGVSALLLAMAVHRLLRQPCPSWAGVWRWARSYEAAVSLGAWAALAVFMTQCGLACPARYLAPFYVLLVAPILVGASESELLPKAGWRWGGMAVFLLGAVLSVLSVSRPLWPAVTVLRALGAEHSSNRLVKRVWTVYSVYDRRADAFAEVRLALPADANPLGAMLFDDPETSLWRPFGSRRLLHVTGRDRPEEMRRRGIRYVLFSPAELKEQYGLSPEKWLAETDAEVVRRFILPLRAGKDPKEWVLARLR